MANKIFKAAPAPHGRYRAVDSENGDAYIYAVDPATGENVGQAILGLVDAGLGDGRFHVVRYGSGAESQVVLADDGKTHIVGLTTPA